MAADLNIWDDINRSAEAIAIEDFSYKPISLSNLLYQILDDTEARKRVLRKNEIPGLFQDLAAIRKHAMQLTKSPALETLIATLFPPENISLITHVDRLFLNAYYRRLLRAQLELDSVTKELPTGLVITGYSHHDVDAAIVGTLRLLRLICRYLGIPNTVTTSTFSLEKLYAPSLWRDISTKLMQYFGEDKIEILETDDSFEVNTVTRLSMQEGMKKIRQSQVLLLLNTVFNTWSGSMLVLKEDQVQVIPGRYITRMLPLLNKIV